MTFDDIIHKELFEKIIFRIENRGWTVETFVDHVLDLMDSKHEKERKK